MGVIMLVYPLFVLIGGRIWSLRTANTTSTAVVLGQGLVGVVVPLDRQWRCPLGSTPSPVLPPLHLFHHLCKCANTTK
jgi:hypothetical protein